MNSYDVGFQLLGPLFYQYNYRLWQKQQYYASIDGAALYMARGGLRMRYFYDLFMSANKNEYAIPQSDFFCSRMAAFKAAMYRNPEPFIWYLQGEYGKHTITDAMSSFLNTDTYNKWESLQTSETLNKYKETTVNITALQTIFLHKNNASDIIQNYFKQQCNFLKQHFDDCLQGKKRALIIDTGWSGSIIQGLTTALPLNPLFAVYFGRYDYQGRWLPWFFHIQGLSIEYPRYSKKYPETSLYLHRHLIEGPCEVRCPSTKEYIFDNTLQKVIPSEVTFNESQRRPNEDEPIALGIADYQAEAKDKIDILKINEFAQKSAKKLQKLIIYPKTSQVVGASPKERSKDFGTDMNISVLLPKAKGGKKKFDNIDRDLWPTGQIAIEYPYFSSIFQTMWVLRKKKGIAGLIGRFFYSITKRL